MKKEVPEKPPQTMIRMRARRKMADTPNINGEKKESGKNPNR